MEKLVVPEGNRTCPGWLLSLYAGRHNFTRKVSTHSPFCHRLCVLSFRLADQSAPFRFFLLQTLFSHRPCSTRCSPTPCGLMTGGRPRSRQARGGPPPSSTVAWWISPDRVCMYICMYGHRKSDVVVVSLPGRFSSCSSVFGSLV